MFPPQVAQHRRLVPVLAGLGPILEELGQTSSLAFQGLVVLQDLARGASCAPVEAVPKLLVLLAPIGLSIWQLHVHQGVGTGNAMPMDHLLRLGF